MIDHVVLNVSDLAASRRFYEAALAPLGYRVGHELDGGVGFAAPAVPDFWLMRRDPVGGEVHVAFTAASRADVDRFHAAALDAGGADHGAPGLRPQYHPAYYGAFVRDPDGNNIEAVCHAGD